MDQNGPLPLPLSPKHAHQCSDYCCLSTISHFEQRVKKASYEMCQANLLTNAFNFGTAFQA